MLDRKLDTGAIYPGSRTHRFMVLVGVVALLAVWMAGGLPTLGPMTTDRASLTLKRNM